MRLGRIILAGLAPLVSLSAFTAGLFPDSPVPSKSQQVAAADSLPTLLRAVVPLFMSAAESVTARPLASRAAHAFLQLEALADTPFRGALWLLASLAVIDLFRRRHQLTLLRC